MTAHDIASNPHLYYSYVRFLRSNLEWECMGYTRSGRTIRFARLIEKEGYGRWGLKQINKYVKPTEIVTIIKQKEK